MMHPVGVGSLYPARSLAKGGIMRSSLSEAELPEIQNIKRPDHLPLIGAILRLLGVKETVDGLLAQDPRNEDIQEAQVAERESLEKLICEWHKRSFSSQADAEAALEQLLKKRQPTYHRLSGQIHPKETVGRYPRRGRPKKGQIPRTQTIYRVARTTPTSSPRRHSRSFSARPSPIVSPVSIRPMPYVSTPATG